MIKQGPTVWGNAVASDVTTADLVFRVMTNEHIPIDLNRKRRIKVPSDEGQTKTPFPPFKHYIIVDGKPVEVGRSHWKGDLTTGEFALEGMITNRLAAMFMLLVERYSKRGNWRGYCHRFDTEALTQRGWLNMNEINETDIILSYDQETKQLKWSKIKSIFRDDYDGKLFHLTGRGFDAMVTPGHKFITPDGLKPVDYLETNDKVILMGEALADGSATYDDAFVELVGWFVTEGNIYHQKSGRNYGRVTLWQNEGDYADRIRACASKLGTTFTEYARSNNRGGKITKNNTMNIAFHLKKEMCLRLLSVAPEKILSIPFILSLSQAQRELLINTMIDADGTRTKENKKLRRKGNGRRYAQKSKTHIDRFLILCTLAGLRTTTRQVTCISYGKPTQIYLVTILTSVKRASVRSIDFHGGEKNGKEYAGCEKLFHPNVPTVDYKGKVWCPETEYGTFIARRNGTIWANSNTYNDEMRSHALLQLSQVSLQFDESKSDNPFAYYTQVIKACFTRVLNIERKNQHIRDDLLIIAGVQPSYTRQIDHEIEQRFGDEQAINTPSDPVPSKVIELPKKRGRKPKVQRDQTDDSTS
ncbi:unnamed protein product [Sphagnum tenellum]